jgi:FAD binding domain
VNLGWKLAAVIAGDVAPALLDTYGVERRPAAERVIMHSRAQLALIRPGTEVTALRELFAELLADPETVHRLSDLVSGNDNRYAVGADAHPLAGRWVPDFAVVSADATRRVAELARAGRPLLIDLTDGAVVAVAFAGIADQITVAAGHPAGDVSAMALLVRPDGYVAWASSEPRPAVDELRRVLAQWFGITVP